MGIFDFVKGQLIDVIEWTDPTSDTIVHKYDMNGKEIMMGAQLTVRESQVAIFVNEGQLADIFRPGRYELQTSNMPILTALKSWKYGFNSPFKIPALDLAANSDELAHFAMQAINQKIAGLGVQLATFVIENISLPEEVEKAMDRRTSMGVVGDLNKYTQYQAAEAMRESANQQGSVAGMGVGMGAGVAMGQMFTQAMNNNQAAPQQAAPAQPAPAGFCPSCGNPITAGAKFCSNCGEKLQTASVCPKCGEPITPGAKFCMNCGEKLQ